MDRTAAARRVASGIFGLYVVAGVGFAVWILSWLGSQDVSGDLAEFAAWLLFMLAACAFGAAVITAVVAVSVWRGTGMVSIVFGCILAAIFVFYGLGFANGEEGNPLVGFAVALPAIGALVALTIAGRGDTGGRSPSAPPSAPQSGWGQSGRV